MRCGRRRVRRSKPKRSTSRTRSTRHCVACDPIWSSTRPGRSRRRDTTSPVRRWGSARITSDLADGRAFVEGFDALDALAKSCGRRAITGASSVPGVSAAVIEAHVDRFATLDSVESGISPGNRTERGLATTRAILGYVGRPFMARIDGAFRPVHGWQSLRRETFEGVGTRWFARCEVPDVGVLPRRYPQLHTCDFRAGLELRRMHFGLWCASWFVRAGLYARLADRAPMLLALSERWLSRGSDVGLMYVDMGGVGHDGATLKLRWTIVARDGTGRAFPRRRPSSSRANSHAAR